MHLLTSVEDAMQQDTCVQPQHPNQMLGNSCCYYVSVKDAMQQDTCVQPQHPNQMQGNSCCYYVSVGVSERCYAAGYLCAAAAPQPDAGK